MNIGLIILAFICILLILKIYFMKKSIREVQKSINYILKSDTNNIITISSTDKDIKNLTINLNKELIELRKQRLQYKNGNQDLKKTITNISHDLRTPLTAISGYVDLIKNNNEKEYIEIIERKTNDLILLTDQLLNFSKTIDMGIKINKEKCCLNEILEEALANYYSIFNAEDIIPQIKICEKRIYKNLDRTTIIRIFENILSNVSKYSNGDFEVTLNEEGKIIFSNKATTLDATTVQKIFDRYFTVENAKQSTGLGLSIAKQLVELNGGKINAKYINNFLIIQIEF